MTAVAIVAAFVVGYWIGKRRGYGLGQLHAYLRVQRILDDEEGSIQRVVRPEIQRRQAPWQ